MLMDSSNLTTVADVLSKKGVTLEPGLSEDEFANIECLAGFRFPPDLRQLLQFALPTGSLPGHFPQWRADPVEVLDRTRGYLADGVAFDVEVSGVWPPAWGPAVRVLLPLWPMLESWLQRHRHSCRSIVTALSRRNQLLSATRFFPSSRPMSSTTAWT